MRTAKVLIKDGQEFKKIDRELIPGEKGIMNLRDGVWYEFGVIDLSSTDAFKKSLGLDI